jgi:uncharacterized protein (TIGR03000 family)
MYSLVVLASLTVASGSTDCCGWLSKCFQRSSCYGCAGSCYGSCAGACYGSCAGGCYGGCRGWTSSSYGCSGCAGASYACHGCYGCYGCYGCAGAGTTTSYYAAPGASTASYTPRANSGASARLVVTLPADATLYVDGNATRSNDQSVRTFRTPELTAGEQFVYTLKAEVVRDGKTLSESKQVIVTAGAETSASFTFGEDRIAAK